MADESDSDYESRKAEADKIKAVSRVFTQIVDLIHELDADGRARLFRTLASMFDDAHPLTTSVPGARPQSQSNSISSFSEDRAISPKQFLLDKNPQTDVERIACLAYYLTHYRETPHFKTLELSKLNTEAAQIKFSNPTKASDNATRSGLLVQVGQAKKQISAIGELYVQALPDRTAAKQVLSNSRRPRRSKRGSSSNTPRSEE